MFAQDILFLFENRIKMYNHTGGVMVIEDSNYKWVTPKIKMCIGYFHKARSIKD